MDTRRTYTDMNLIGETTRDCYGDLRNGPVVAFVPMSHLAVNYMHRITFARDYWSITVWTNRPRYVLVDCFSDVQNDRDRSSTGGSARCRSLLPVGHYQRRDLARLQVKLVGGRDAQRDLITVCLSPAG